MNNKNTKKKLARVHHIDLFGKREDKFKFLEEKDIDSFEWKELALSEPYYFFVPKDFESQEEYEKGFKIDELFRIGTSGIKTHNDKELVNFDEFPDQNNRYLYRPFDLRNINYDLHKVIRHRYSVMKHCLSPNLVVLTTRQLSTFDFQHVFVSTQLADICSVSMQTKESTYAFPLYLYADDGSKTSNINDEIADKIKQLNGTFTPEELFDYIYAVLHSPNYREKYKEFLKIDFPRVPYPKDRETFGKLVKLGKQLRELHLMESPKISEASLPFPIEGSDLVERVKYEDSKVFINSTQYFDNVPEIAWNFYIGGYQPAQKWLKDRKGRELSYEDMEHYQRVIFVLLETDKLMKEIDTVIKF